MAGASQKKAADIRLKPMIKTFLLPILSAALPSIILLAMLRPPIVAKIPAAAAAEIPGSVACGTICTVVVNMQ